MGKINDGMICYKSLSPNENIEETYAFDALEHALNEESILNIAVTAPYGAGKSSVIKTFFSQNEEKYKEKKLFVSLACFNDSCFGEKFYKKETVDIDEKALENSILQQLFFTETVHNFPWSNYFRIKNYKVSDLLKILLIIMLGLYSLLRFGYLENANKVISDSFKWWGNIPLFISIAIFAIFLYFVIAKIIEFIRNVHSIKCNCAAGEVEIQEKNSSPLNDKIDEILYFFETTKYECIVFEDLDRFESKKIFVKLRELNKLINGYKGIAPRRIKFIYALNDDVFSSTNRVKFFDFIIPIIPKISRTNVGDFFLSQVKEMEGRKYEKNLLDRVDKSVINDLGYYIDDLRLLNNIQNEFFIYCKSYYSPERFNNFLIGNEKADKNEITELFCLILYKNLYPEDFKNYHFGKGILYNLFKLEEKIIEYCKNEINSDGIDNEDYSLKKMAQHCPQYIKEYLNCQDKNLVDFLVAFVGRGLITKNYYTFISHIYPGELSNDDFALVKKMKNSSGIGFEDKIDDVELVLSKTSEEIWDSNAILNKYILNHICKNNQDDYIRRFIKSLFTHDQVEKQNQYLKNYANDIFNEKTNPFIIEMIDWTKLSLFFNEQNLFAFWDLIKIAKGKQDEKISGKIRYFFTKVEQIVCSTENIHQIMEHQDLMRHYGMKIRDVSNIDVSNIKNKKLLKKIGQKNLYELNRKNIQILFPEFSSDVIMYSQIKKNVILYQHIKKNINEFIENLVLTNYCRLDALELSNLILNPNIIRKNIAQLVSIGELASIDLSKVNPRQYDHKSEFLNTYGIKALIQHKKIEYNDETIQLLKLKYNIILQQPTISSSELDELKKIVKSQPVFLKKAYSIQEYITRNSLQNNSDIIKYAIKVFLHSEKLGPYLIFASKLINDHFEYVESILAESSGRGLSVEIFTSPFIKEEKKKRMLEMVDFPNKIISLYNRSPSAAKWLFGQYEKLLDNESIVDIYRHVFDKEISVSEEQKANYTALRNTLKKLQWDKTR